MAQNMENIERDLDRWIDKWSYILRNDQELSKASALVALRQIKVIVDYNMEKRDRTRSQL